MIFHWNKIKYLSLIASGVIGDFGNGHIIVSANSREEAIEVACDKFKVCLCYHTINAMGNNGSQVHDFIESRVKALRCELCDNSPFEYGDDNVAFLIP